MKNGVMRVGPGWRQAITNEGDPHLGGVLYNAENPISIPHSCIFAASLTFIFALATFALVGTIFAYSTFGSGFLFSKEQVGRPSSELESSNSEIF